MQKSTQLTSPSAQTAPITHFFPKRVNPLRAAGHYPRPSLIPVRDKQAEIEELKDEFLGCLGRCQVGTSGLRVAIHRAFEAGFTRADLIQWGASVHYTVDYMRRIISLSLLQSGARSRKSGAGPKTPKEALDLLAFAENSYGPRAGKLLRAAYRAFKNRSSVSSSPQPLKPLNDPSSQ